MALRFRRRTKSNAFDDEKRKADDLMVEADVLQGLRIEVIEEEANTQLQE